MSKRTAGIYTIRIISYHHENGEQYGRSESFFQFEDKPENINENVKQNSLFTYPEDEHVYVGRTITQTFSKF